MQGKLQLSKLVRLSSSSSRLTVLARTANQLVLMPPVAKKRSVEQPIKRESAESVTDWGNKMGAIGFLPILNTEAWENTEIA